MDITKKNSSNISVIFMIRKYFSTQDISQNPKKKIYTAQKNIKPTSIGLTVVGRPWCLLISRIWADGSADMEVNWTHEAMPYVLLSNKHSAAGKLGDAAKI